MNGELIIDLSLSGDKIDNDDNSNKSYYHSYSSEIVHKEQPKKPEFVAISPQEYFEKRINIGKYKLPELKQLAKHYSLRVSGNKHEVVKRIENYFKEHKHSIIIQKAFRGHLVRYSFALRGEALKTRNCVNSTDFYTMEPLEEIEFERFFSYRDKTNFLYGFDLFSLLHLYKTSGKMENPYNREAIDLIVIRKMFSLCKIMKIVFPHITKPELDILNSTQIFRQRVIQRTTHRVREMPHTLTQTQLVAHTTANRQEAIVQLHIPNYNGHNNRESAEPARQNANLSVSQRIQEVFMEIDNLGNYTDVSWFLSLSRNGYVSFYAIYSNWWSRLSNEIRNSICPNGNPFRNARSISQETSIEYCREICLVLIENMIYNGINIEYRRLGALHVLTILTRVSPQAREAIPWLTDIIAF